MTSEQKPKSPWLSVGGIVGAVIGFYCGIMMVIPIVLAAIVFAILKKIEAPKFELFKLGAAAIIGHMAWMTLGAATVPAAAGQVVPDIVLMILGFIWLVAKPGAGPVWFFTLYEIICLVVNVLSILGTQFGSSGHKALTAHISLRIFIIVALWAALKARKAAAPVTEAVS
jgi:hypothetical protein